MGTELMAPLLYSLVRSLRPRRLLEVGMGYTTPFILRALADNTAEVEREREAMVAKSASLVAALASAPRGASGELLTGWLHADPPLRAPGFYQLAYEPRLHAIDRLSHPSSTARWVEDLAARLGLSAYLETHYGDFRRLGPVVAPPGQPLDFVWFDCGDPPDYLDFLAEYWDRISDRGGLLLLHQTLNDADTAAVVHDLKARQARAPHEFELLSLVEPHKALQGSFTLIRKTGAFQEPHFDPVRTIQDAVQLLGKPAASPPLRGGD